MSKKEEKQKQEPQAQEEKLSTNTLLQILIAIFATHRVRDHREEGR
jgi:hypothetical protein